MRTPPPLAYRLLLGQALRAHRERAGLDAGDVAKELGWYARKVAFVEGGHRVLALTETERLAELYSLSPPERDHVLMLAAEARRRDRETRPVAVWAQAYVAVEAAATRLRVFYEELIPGFIQSERYARAVLSTAVIPAAGGIDSAVAKRLARAAHVMGENAPQVILVLGEAALHRRVGGTGGLRQQLDTLRHFAQLDHVTLKVLPFDAGAHAPIGTSFTLLDVGDPSATFAFTETMVDGEWHDSATYTQHFAVAFERVFAAALTPAKSESLLAGRIRELEE
ncbi:helix-turn-helix domain-containing protein [Actinoalloteichus spitiensis]|uniref:helix-turn-helix domain-containing protein n=1 Tax=Actinoalloteichus spitiensis TaxID=252394 RepID=UPI00030DAEEF|nr:helix-turn-helix transcriptional regulator [Actinoalloteichus spitiensis]